MRVIYSLDPKESERSRFVSFAKHEKENEACSLILRMCRFSLTARLHFLGDCFKLKKREKEKKK